VCVATQPSSLCLLQRAECTVRLGEAKIGGWRREKQSTVELPLISCLCSSAGCTASSCHISFWACVNKCHIFVERHGGLRHSTPLSSPMGSRKSSILASLAASLLQLPATSYECFLSQISEWYFSNPSRATHFLGLQEYIHISVCLTLCIFPISSKKCLFSFIQNKYGDHGED